MSDFYYLANYQQKGKMGISRKAFETIATIASNNLKCVKVKGYGKEDPVARINTIFSFPARPCHAFFKKNGRVDLTVDVELVSGIKDITNICTKLQEEVANNVNMMCETVPVQVEIHLTKEKPAKQAKPKKEKEPKEHHHRRKKEKKPSSEEAK